MPIVSTKFGALRNNLRQMPDVQGELVTKLYTLTLAEQKSAKGERVTRLYRGVGVGSAVRTVMMEDAELVCRADAT